MTLLVHRDPLYLIETKGKVEAIKKLPDFLSKSPLIAHPSLIHERRNWDFVRELFFKELAFEVNYDKVLTEGRDPFDYCFKRKLVHNFPIEGIPALWSGWRSCILRDENKQMYRLKGLTFRNPPKVVKGEDCIMIEGGQRDLNAENERIYSNRFNKFLREEGIEPAMEYVGKYVYPIKADRHKLAASIMKVKGDTRLDELTDILEINMEVLESLASSSKNKYYLASKIAKIREKTNQLYFDLGFIVGRMKNLMTKINMTWSDNMKRINHHLGNVVVYPSEENLCLGFVDFESACNGRDMGKKSIRQQQLEEFIAMKHFEIIRGACARDILISDGEDFWECFNYNATYCSKEHISKGFVEGYRSKSKKLTNKIESYRLEEVVSLLHQSNALLTNQNPSQEIEEDDLLETARIVLNS